MLHLDNHVVREFLEENHGLADVSHEACIVFTSAIEYLVRHLLAETVKVVGALSEDGNCWKGMRAEENRITGKFLQYTIRTDDVLWKFLNSSFGMQVVLAYTLDPATEEFFELELGLPIHSYKDISAHDYYLTVASYLSNYSPSKDSVASQEDLSAILLAVQPAFTLCGDATILLGALIREGLSAMCQMLSENLVGHIDEKRAIDAVFSFMPEVMAEAAMNLADGELSVSKPKGLLRIRIRHAHGVRMLGSHLFAVQGSARMTNLFERACANLCISRGCTSFVYNGQALRDEQTLADVYAGDDIVVWCVPAKWWAKRERDLVGKTRGHSSTVDRSVAGGTTSRRYSDELTLTQLGQSEPRGLTFLTDFSATADVQRLPPVEVHDKMLTNNIRIAIEADLADEQRKIKPDDRNMLTAAAKALDSDSAFVYQISIVQLQRNDKKISAGG
jgi:hypothetical protein